MSNNDIFGKTESSRECNKDSMAVLLVVLKVFCYLSFFDPVGIN